MRDTTVHAVLAAVETLDAHACGALTVEVGGNTVGTVFVERKQVCWAAHSGLTSRLRDLLKQHLAKALDDAGLEREYQQSSAEGTPFGEALVARNFIKANAMRSALKQHTIESLLALPQGQGETFGWVPHRYQGYQPRFTFSPAELLVNVNATLYEVEAIGADLDLACLDIEVRGASFVPADDDGLVAVRIAGPRISVGQLDELAEWAEAAFAVTRGFSRELLRRSIEAATGDVWLAWRTSRRQTHAAMLESGPMLRDLFAKLEARNLSIVVSRRPAGMSRTVRDGLGSVDSNP